MSDLVRPLIVVFFHAKAQIKEIMVGKSTIGSVSLLNCGCLITMSGTFFYQMSVASEKINICIG